MTDARRTEPRLSASVVLTRAGREGIEVFLVERSKKLRFLGGYWAFPGGVIDAVDEDFDEPARACALRELFEETGVLPPILAAKIGDEGRDIAREEILRRDSDPDRFVKVLNDARHALDALEELGSITTPPFAPRRYKNRFFHYELPPAEWPTVRHGELVDGRFMQPGEALRLWLEGEMSIAPPILLLLELLDRRGPAGFYDAVRKETAALDAGKLHPASFSPGVLAFPLRTDTIPPATTTNCYVVGHRRLYVIDPASPDEDEQARLFAKLDELVAEGRCLQGVVVTHHHPDHVGAVLATAKRYDIPVLAHPLTLSRLPDGCGDCETQEIDEGDALDLGLAPDGAEDWYLETLFTPGHDRGHLAFIESRYRATIVGDLCSTISTIVIDPPEGHLRTYLDSLRRMLGREITTLYPAHGPAVREGRELIRKFLDHRVVREDQLVQALGEATEPALSAALVKLVYRDVPESMHGLAERSLLAGLEKLEEDGIAARRGEGWTLVARG